MTIEELLDKCINDKLIDLTISGPKIASSEMPKKVKVRPVQLNSDVSYQSSEYIGTKVFHTNYNDDEIKIKVSEWIKNDFKQAQFMMTDADAQVLSSKKGKLTVKYRC